MLSHVHSDCEVETSGFQHPHSGEICTDRMLWMALPCRWGQVVIRGVWFGSACRKLGVAWRPHPRYGSLAAVHASFVRWSSRQLRWWGLVHSIALWNAPISKAFLLWQKCMYKRGQIKWGVEVRLAVAASANCGQDPQWHYTQCGSAVLVMFTAWDSFLADFVAASSPFCDRACVNTCSNICWSQFFTRLPPCPSISAPHTFMWTYHEISILLGLPIELQRVVVS